MTEQSDVPQVSLNWNPRNLEIKTRTVERTLEPLVMQVRCTIWIVHIVKLKTQLLLLFKSTKSKSQSVPLTVLSILSIMNNIKREHDSNGLINISGDDPCQLQVPDQQEGEVQESHRPRGCCGEGHRELRGAGRGAGCNI